MKYDFRFEIFSYYRLIITALQIPLIFCYVIVLLIHCFLFLLMTQVKSHSYVFEIANMIDKKLRKKITDK